MSATTEETLALFLEETYGSEKLSSWKDRRDKGGTNAASDILSTVSRCLRSCAEEARQSDDTDKLQLINDMLELPPETSRQVIFSALERAYNTRKVVMT